MVADDELMSSRRISINESGSAEKSEENQLPTSNVGSSSVNIDAEFCSSTELDSSRHNSGAGYQKEDLSLKRQLDGGYQTKQPAKGCPIHAEATLNDTAEQLTGCLK
jgi:hypothetical protein